MGEVERFPWDKPEPQPADLLEALRKDFAYAVQTSAITVFSSNPAFRATFNTPRGQLVPAGAVKFKDGTTVEMRDIGMCQPGAAYLTVQEIMAEILNVAAQLGLELEQ